MMITVSNLLNALPDARSGETMETVVSARGLRLERIVSHGQASPEHFWYDQDEAEWVMVLKGRARLAIEGHPEERVLCEGDTVFLPAHCRHRVTWTEPNRPTVWLALFVEQALTPIASGLIQATTAVR